MFQIGPVYLFFVLFYEKFHMKRVTIYIQLDIRNGTNFFSLKKIVKIKFKQIFFFEINSLCQKVKELFFLIFTYHFKDLIDLNPNINCLFRLDQDLFSETAKNDYFGQKITDNQIPNIDFKV